MVVHSISLPLARSLAADCAAGDPQAMQFFRYAPHDASSYRQRLKWLKERPLPHRHQLAEGLKAYNLQLGNHPEALKQIERLRRQDACVVIAGQQAGVLTGPLYTVYKAIHVLRLAQLLEEQLAVPVVPVFWIAGEDHDLDEVNHVYLPASETKPQKYTLPLAGRRRSASMLPVAREELAAFLDTVLGVCPETIHTPELRALLAPPAESAATLADWFAQVMARLFGRYGLVLVESTLPFVRELERPVFADVIRESGAIEAMLKEADQRILAAGYTPQLQVEPGLVPLFRYEEGERKLLGRSGGRFVLRDGRRTWELAALLELVEREPERFSANVVSRPLAQERIFPTLAFVGGPGEIAYWAYFDRYFTHMGEQLPVVVPRLSATLLEGNVARTLEQLELPAATVLTGFSRWKADWEARVKPVSLTDRFDEAREEIRRLYEPLVREAAEQDPGLRQLAEENLRRILHQVDFLRERTERSALMRHDVTRRRIDRVETALVPRGAWQERVYNITWYLNRYGPDLVDHLMAAPLAMDGRHNLIHI